MYKYVRILIGFTVTVALLGCLQKNIMPPPSGDPARRPDMPSLGVLNKSRPAKIFLMGSSEMVKDNVLDAEGKSPNAMFILNILDALNHRESIAAMRSKEQRFNPLMETGAFAKTLIKTFNVAGLPVLVVFFGLFVWLHRHTRKKRIQMMFQK